MKQQAIGMIVVAGDAATVKAALDAGAAAAKKVGGEKASVDVISRTQNDFGIIASIETEATDDVARNDQDNNLDQAARHHQSLRFRMTK